MLLGLTSMAPELKERLAAARKAAGHTQAACANTLASLGAPGRSQASVSRYLAGKQSMPLDVAHAVSKYINMFSSGDSAEDDPEKAGAALQPPPRDEPVGDFAGMVRRLTDEPLLGPRQGALVDSLTQRLATGPPLSDQDRGAFESLMHILGIA